MDKWKEKCGICRHYLAIKHRILSFAERQMGLEVITLNELNQAWKDRSHAFSHLWNLDLKAKLNLKVEEGFVLGKRSIKWRGTRQDVSSLKSLILAHIKMS